MSLIKKLIFVFKHGKDIEALIRKEAAEREHAVLEARKDNLYLCFRHQQEWERSVYSEKNCDHCKLQRKLEIAESEPV